MHDLYIAHVYVDPWHCLFVALFLFASTHRAPKTAIPLRCRVTVVQGHSRSSKLVSNESPRATSYWFSCLRFRDMTYSSKIYGFSLFTPPPVSFEAIAITRFALDLRYESWSQSLWVTYQTWKPHDPTAVSFDFFYQCVTDVRRADRHTAKAIRMSRCSTAECDKNYYSVLPNWRRKIFGWLANFTNSAEPQKNRRGARCTLIKFGVALRRTSAVLTVIGSANLTPTVFLRILPVIPVLGCGRLLVCVNMFNYWQINSFIVLPLNAVMHLWGFLPSG